MKRSLSIILAATIVSSTVPAIAQQAEAPISIKADRFPAHIRIRLEEKAREGPAALVQYLDRTRMMGYHIRADEITVARPEASVAEKANDATQVAAAERK